MRNDSVRRAEVTGATASGFMAKAHANNRSARRHPNTRAWGRAAGVGLAALLAGCEVGPNFKPGASPAVALSPVSLKSPGKISGDRQQFVRDLDIPGEWWGLFHSRPLNNLVERAMRDNHDLAAAQSALRVARANVEAQRGAFFPTIEANKNSIRGKSSVDVSGPTSSGGDFYTLHTKQVSLAYAPDVFGGVRRAVEVLQATQENQRYQLEATYLTLTSNLALAAIQEASLREQLRTTQRIVNGQRDRLGLLKTQLKLGQVAEVDVALQESALAQAELAVVPLQKQLAINRDLLTALSGHFAGEGLPETFTFATLTLPQNLPLSLPSDIIMHRPDVAAAAANVHAASAQIGVTVANRLPQFSIMGIAGKQAVDYSNLFSTSPAYSFWSIAGSVTQVLFDGFTLEQKQRAAEAGYEQVLQQYRSTVVLAFQNIADALQALEYDARLLHAAQSLERASSKGLRLVREQYKLGQVSSLDVINVQQSNLNAMLAVVQARAARYTDTVALFQALGGGWWNRSDVAAPQDPQGPTLVEIVVRGYGPPIPSNP